MSISRNQCRTVLLLARERGIVLDRLFKLAAEVRDVTVDESSSDIGWGHLYAMTFDEYTELLEALRAMPVSEEGREQYRRDTEELEREAFRDRRAAARFLEDDPHVRAQREGWGS